MHSNVRGSISWTGTLLFRYPEIKGRKTRGDRMVKNSLNLLYAIPRVTTDRWFCDSCEYFGLISDSPEQIRWHQQARWGRQVEGECIYEYGFGVKWIKYQIWCGHGDIVTIPVYDSLWIFNPFYDVSGLMIYSNAVRARKMFWNAVKKEYLLLEGISSRLYYWILSSEYTTQTILPNLFWAILSKT